MRQLTSGVATSIILLHARFLFSFVRHSAFESYRYEPRSGDDDKPPISCPLVCLGGEEDSMALRGDLDHWARFTTGEFRLKMFDGGHFFLQGKGEPAVLGFLSDVLAPLY